MLQKIFMRIFLLFLGISLVACSNNTPNQNIGMGVGAVAGGLVGSAIGAGTGKAVAIGAGIIAGALIGGAIGKSMDDSDRMKMQSSLSNNPNGKPTYWVNTRTGAHYRMVPGSRVTVNGNPNCRRYTTMVIVGGKKERMHGIACPNPDGSWVSVTG